MKKYFYIAITSLLFIARILLFVATQDVGMEHDSGWYLGMARNVAERGIYAADVNTVAVSNNPGSFPSIHGRFSSQDKNGFIYFPAGVTVGPSYILPEAFFLKLFGYGWIQFRMWPFISFCILIPLLFYIVMNVGSIFSLLFFQAWLWFYPQIFLNQSYEALSEHVALLFLLAGFVLLQKAIKSKNNLFLALSGLSLGLSVQTKNIYALGVIFSCIAVIYFSNKVWKNNRLKHILIFGLFLLLPTLLFELYRFAVLFSQFGLIGYWRNNIDIKRTWESGGSGIIILRTGIDLRFVYNKLAVWKHLGVDPFAFVWPLLLACPFLKLSQFPSYDIFSSTLFELKSHRSGNSSTSHNLKFANFREGGLKKKGSILFWNLFFSTLFFFTWFALFSSTGWFRHIFPAVVMGMILISASVDLLFSLTLKTKNVALFLLFCLFLSHVFISLISSNLSISPFVITKKRILTLIRSSLPNKMQGPLSHPIFSKNNQNEVSRFIQKNIKPSQRICFYEWALVAELPPLVDRVFFPYPRCSAKDVLIIGPYQKGPYALKNTNLSFIQKNVCKKVLFSNEEYSVCSLYSP